MLHVSGHDYRRRSAVEGRGAKRPKAPSPSTGEGRGEGASARERAVADHNYGSTLMCWDRWFGTYLREPAGGVRSFGVEEGPVGINPLRIQLAPLLRYVRGR